MRIALMPPEWAHRTHPEQATAPRRCRRFSRRRSPPSQPALVAAPFLLGELGSFFYQPSLLALTHALTLGWVSLTNLVMRWRAPAGSRRVAVVVLASTAPRARRRLAAAYGVAGIVGWMSNLIIGISYKLFPGFVAAARTQLGRRPVPLAVLGAPARLPSITFGAFNAGVGAGRARAPRRRRGAGAPRRRPARRRRCHLRDRCRTNALVHGARSATRMEPAVRAAVVTPPQLLHEASERTGG